MYSNTTSLEMFNAMNSTAMQRNNMKDFKKFLESDERVQNNISAIKYTYNNGMQLYTKDCEGHIVKCDITDLYANAVGYNMNSAMSGMSMGMTSFSDMSILTELISDDSGVSEIEKNRYELVYGSWPAEKDEVVLILSQNNELPDIILYTLGYKDTGKVQELMKVLMTGGTVEDYGRTEWDFDEAMEQTFKVILPYEKYSRTSEGIYTDLTQTDAGLELLYNSADVGLDLKIVGFIRPTGDMAQTSMGYVGYISPLTDYLMENEKERLNLVYNNERVITLDKLPKF